MKRPSLVHRSFRLLLSAYPQRLRQAYGDDMLDLLADLERDALHGQPSVQRAIALCGFWLRVLADAATSIYRSRRWQRQHSIPPARPKRRSGPLENGPREHLIMSTLRHDLAIGWRRLGKSPAFTVVAALTLALGIGANTAIFSVVYGVLLRPIGVQDPASLAVLAFHPESNPGDRSGFWPAHLAELRQAVEGRADIRQLSSFMFESVTLLDGPSAEEVGVSLMVENNFFDVLGVPTVLGRTFNESDRVAGRRGQVAVIGETWWRQRFGADEAILGRQLVLDGEPVTVVGVMPAKVPLPQAGVQLWMPQHWDPEDRTLIGRLGVIGRFDSPVEGNDAAASLLAGTAQQLGASFPRLRGYTVTFESFHASLIGSSTTAILAAAIAVGLLALIACANMAALMLSRAATREREMATRRALGARRLQISSQLIIESLMLATLGGVAGIVLAFAVHRLLLGMASNLIPRTYDIHLDLPVLGFAAALTLVTGLVFGLAPVAYTFTRNLAFAMRSAIGGGRTGLSRVRQLLVAAQVAVAVVLVAGAGVMARSLLELHSVDAGFSGAGIGGARIYLDDDAYPTDEQESLYFQRMFDELAQRRDIASAGASTGLPMDPLTINYDLPYSLPGQAVDEERPAQAFFRAITPGYLATLGIPVRRGRAIDSTDHADSEAVALINETFARIGWGDSDPVGQSFAIYGGSRQLRVIGVIGDVRFSGPTEATRPEFFVPHAQFTYSAMTIVARAASGDAGQATAAIADIAKAIDPTQPVNSTFVMDDLVIGAVAGERFFTRLLAVFATIALLLAASGLYGVISYWVNESRHEIGLRLAIGARGGDILSLVLRRSLTVATIGLVFGLGATILAGRWLEHLIYGATASDAITLIGVAAVLMAVSVLATMAPALRAARMPPGSTLKLD